LRCDHNSDEVNMRVGICGYPGSGKSTVFAALAPGASDAKAGIAWGSIKVPDKRVDAMADIFSPKKTTYTEIQFMDVGGAGGRTGAFPPAVVQAMRNADVLAHVVRGFDNPMVADDADPARDETRFDEELILLDQDMLERIADRWRREQRKGAEVEVVDRSLAWLEAGKPLRSLGLEPADVLALGGLQLLSLTPLITLYNLSEDAWADPDLAHLRAPGTRDDDSLTMAICAGLEAEIVDLEPEEQAEFLEGLGIGEPARDEFIRTAYRLLDLVSFLTVGPDECRAWTIRRGMNARKAGGRIHSDIERGFIRAEVYRWEDLLEYGTEAKLKSAGKMRLEGKEYLVVDGDVCNFRFNV